MTKKEKKYLCNFIFWLGVTISAILMAFVNGFYDHWTTAIIAVIIVCLSGGPMFYYYEKFINEGDTENEK